jgi:VWFA-related protein
MAPLLGVVIVATLLSAQVGEGERDYRIRTTSELVLLDVAVENSRGVRIPDLTKENFRIFEDKKPQSIGSFQAGDVPVTIGLVVDQSGSMRPRRDDVLSAARMFIQASNPEDQIFIVNFNDHVSLGLPEETRFSNDPVRLNNAIAAVPAQGRTALNDAVIMALNHAASGPLRRKALLIISDGGDNASKHRERELIDSVEEVQATLYTIGVYSDDDPDRNPGLLRRIANISGGETYLPTRDRSQSLPKTLEHIAKEIRSRYTLAYVPNRENASGGVRQIRVEAFDSKGNRYVVRARRQYRLPDLTEKGGEK